MRMSTEKRADALLSELVTSVDADYAGVTTIMQV